MVYLLFLLHAISSRLHGGSVKISCSPDIFRPKSSQIHAWGVGSSNFLDLNNSNKKTNLKSEQLRFDLIQIETNRSPWGRTKLSWKCRLCSPKRGKSLWLPLTPTRGVKIPNKSACNPFRRWRVLLSGEEFSFCHRNEFSYRWDPIACPTKVVGKPKNYLLCMLYNFILFLVK